MLMNFRPMSVSTDALYGGLNQIVFRVRVCVCVCYKGFQMLINYTVTTPGSQPVIQGMATVSTNIDGYNSPQQVHDFMKDLTIFIVPISAFCCKHLINFVGFVIPIFLRLVERVFVISPVAPSDIGTTSKVYSP